MNILMGILLILGAFSILEFPAISGMVMCWVLIGSMLVAGIFSIVRFIEAKNAEKVAKKNGKSYLRTGIGSLIFGIAAVITAVIAMTTETGADIFMDIITTLFGVMIVMDGVSFIVHAIQLKKQALPGWVGMIVMGALLAVAGIVCILSIYTALVSLGTMCGISMLLAGTASIIA